MRQTHIDDWRQRAESEAMARAEEMRQSAARFLDREMREINTITRLLSAIGEFDSLQEVCDAAGLLLMRAHTIKAGLADPSPKSPTAE